MTIGLPLYRDGGQYEFSTVDSVEEFRLKNLKPFTSYEVVVQAFNSIGAGPFSQPTVGTTLEGGKKNCIFSLSLNSLETPNFG